MVIEATLALALLAAPDDRPWERARVVDTLQTLIETGEPRHVDHDEGQELWATLSPLVQGGADPELQVLAQRAACPIIVRVHRPLAAIGELDVTTKCVLPLSSRVPYSATVEGNLDGRGWRKLLDVQPDGTYGFRFSGAFSRKELAAGFHHLNLRARMRFERPLPGMVATELRQLPSVAFGLHSGPPAPDSRSLVAAAEYRARTARVTSLEPTLADQPLAAWLSRFASRVEWTTDWCDLHSSPERDHWTPIAVCEVAMFSAAGSTEGEVWIRIGELHVESEPLWTDVQASLEGAYLRRSADRTPVPLALMPMLAVADKQSWPGPLLTIAAVDVTVPIVLHGNATIATVPIAVENHGQADAFGITIDVSAGNGELPLVRRRFVRDIPVGGHVDVPISVPLPLPYGWAVVVPLIGTHDGMLMSEQNFDPPFKVIFINRDAAPAGFVTGVCQGAAGTPSC